MASTINIEEIANAFSKLLIVEQLVDSKVVMVQESNYSGTFNCTTQNPASQNAKKEFAKLLKNSINILSKTVNTTIILKSKKVLFKHILGLFILS